MTTAQSFLQTALAEVGNGPEKYNTGGQPWCAIFVNWCLSASGDDRQGTASAASFSSFGTHHINGDGYHPKGGDLLIVGLNGGWAEHVAIVESCSQGRITAINGNGSGNKVTRSERPYDSTVTIIEMSWAYTGTSGKISKIFLNPGHGNTPEGYDSGAVGNGYYEADLTREVVKGIESALSGYAEVTVWDYEKDLFSYDVSIDWSQYDYFLSVHFNAVGGNGCEIYHQPGRNDEKIDALILSKVADAGEFENRGIKTADHKVTRISDKCANGGTTSALLEICFVDDSDDMEKYQQHKSQIAAAIADGIKEGLGLSYTQSYGGWQAPWVQRDMPNNSRALRNKTYERYWKIQNQATENYKISCGENAATHESGLRIYKDKFLIIALGSYYGKVGTYVKIAFDNGAEIVCIKGDEKDDRETNTDPPAHSYHVDGPGVVESSQISVNLLEVQADTESGDWQQEFAAAFDQYAGEGTYQASITGIWTSDSEPQWQQGSSGSDKQTFFSDTNEKIPIHPDIFNLSDLYITNEIAVYAGNRNITASVGPISWSSTVGEISSSIDIEVAKNDAKFMSVYQPKKGEIIRFFTPKEIFRGVIVSEDIGDKHSSKFTSVDPGWYLNKTKDTYQFTNMPIPDAIRKICGDISVSIAYLDEDELAGILITEVYIDKAISEVIQDLLDHAAGKWNFDFVPTGMRIYQLGSFLSEPKFRTSKNTQLRDSVKYRGSEKQTSSIEDMKNAVKVISDTHVLAKSMHQDSYLQYGFLQEVVQIDPEKEDAQSVADAKLQELNREKNTRGFTMLVDIGDNTKAGDILLVDGVKYVIESASHSLSQGRHTLDVELERIEIV